MIRVVDVTQHYGVKPVLKHVSLDIPAATRTVVIGPNGMGKTTLLSVLGGVLEPQHGYVEIDGIRRRSSVENELALRRRVVFLPDRGYLPKNRTGREFLLGVGRLYEIDENRLIDRAQRLLNLFQLTELADSPIRTYSAGQQKKIALSSALVTGAEVLLLDEPFSGGLDPMGILALKQVLKRLTMEQGCTVVLTSPVPELVTEIADRLIVVRDGQIAVEGTLDEIRRKTGYTGNLEEMLNRVIFPETLINVDAYFAREERMRAWFRVVLLGPGLAFGFMLAYAATYIPNVVYWIYTGVFPVNADWEIIQIPLLVMAAAAYGLTRAVAFHPGFMEEYRKWLNQTPWRYGLPLPAGPIHLVPQDVVVVGVLCGLGTWRLPEFWWMVPSVFLASYLAGLLIGFIRTRLDWHAFLLAFGLGGAVLLYQTPWGLGLLFLGLYGIAYHGLARWLKEPGLPVADERICFDAETTRNLKIKLGWPYDYLGPLRERHPISIGRAAAFAMVAGWWEFVLISVEFESFIFIATIGPLFLAGMRLKYIWGYAPPISMWGRIRTFRWIIPGYDVVFVAPVMILLLLWFMKWLVFDCGVTQELALPLVLGAIVFVALACPPSLDQWRLTGNHRIVPAVNKQEMQQIS